MEEILHQLMCSLSHYLPGLSITGGWFAPPPQKENENSNFQPFFRCTNAILIIVWEYGIPKMDG